MWLGLGNKTTCLHTGKIGFSQDTNPMRGDCCLYVCLSHPSTLALSICELSCTLSPCSEFLILPQRWVYSGVSWDLMCLIQMLKGTLCKVEVLGMRPSLIIITDHHSFPSADFIIKAKKHTIICADKLPTSFSELRTSSSLNLWQIVTHFSPVWSFLFGNISVRWQGDLIFQQSNNWDIFPILFHIDLLGVTSYVLIMVTAWTLQKK